MPIREERDARDRPDCTPPGGNFGVGCGVPDLDCLVGAAGSQPPAIGTEREAGDILLVATQCLGFPVAGVLPDLDSSVGPTDFGFWILDFGLQALPDLDGSVGSARGELPPVRAERDMEHPIAVAHQRLSEFSGSRVPELDRAVPARGRDRFSIGMIAQTRDRPAVTRYSSRACRFAMLRRISSPGLLAAWGTAIVEPLTEARVEPSGLNTTPMTF